MRKSISLLFTVGKWSGPSFEKLEGTQGCFMPSFVEMTSGSWEDEHVKSLQKECTCTNDIRSESSLRWAEMFFKKTTNIQNV